MRLFQIHITKKAFSGSRLAAVAVLLPAILVWISSIPAKDGGWDYESYRVQIVLAIDVPGGLAEMLADELPSYVRHRVEASLVPAWKCQTRLAIGAEREQICAAVSASSPAAPEPKSDNEKLLLAAIRWTPECIVVTTREFDRYVQRWGMPIRRESRQQAALSEDVFSLVWYTFSPLAQIELDPKDSNRVVLKPRGALLPRASGAAPLAKPGDVFLPIVRRTTRGGTIEKNGIQVVPWTYIEAAELNDNRITGRVQSASRHPFAAKREGRVDPLALALRADPDATTLHLRSRTAAARPLVGYEVFAQTAGTDSLARVGVSDTAGDVRIAPGKSRVQFFVVKHGGQLMARVPMVAGAERRIEMPLPDDDARLAAEVRLAAVREDLIDVVARRNILISRTRQKIKKKDYDGAEELLRALDDLPGRPQFNQTLSSAASTLKADEPQMQRRIKQLFDATQTLLTQYLDLGPINELKDELREAKSKPGGKTPEPPSARKS